MSKTVRIGCASAFWGDTCTAAAQLVHGGKLDYLVFDYLAEVTMSILAAARIERSPGRLRHGLCRGAVAAAGRDPTPGHPRDQQRGGIHPQACAAALQAACDAAQLPLKIAVLLGDDLQPQLKHLRGSVDMFNGAPLPPLCVSANAYLGAPGIVRALELGADIVITGRVVDSAVVSAALVHEFNWSWQDYDRLAQAALAGHIIECGAQCTGGNFTDWRDVPDYEHIGFPIVDVSADGQFTVNKVAGTGGLISELSVAEQLLYEIGDPRAYLLPDVICDFSQVKLQQQGDNQRASARCQGFAAHRSDTKSAPLTRMAFAAPPVA